MRLLPSSPVEGVTHRAAEQGAWGDDGVIGRDHKINRNGGLLKHLQVSKEMPTTHHCGEILQTLSRNRTCWGVPPKSLYSKTHIMSKKMS